MGRLSCFGRWALTGDFVRHTYPQCLNACFPPSVRRSNSDGFPSQHTARGPATSLAGRLNETDSFRAAQLFQEVTSVGQLSLDVEKRFDYTGSERTSTFNAQPWRQASCFVLV